MRKNTDRRDVELVLAADGFFLERQSGSHSVYRRGDQQIIIAAHGNRVGAPLERIRRQLQRLRKERESAEAGA